MKREWIILLGLITFLIGFILAYFLNIKLIGELIGIIGSVLMLLGIFAEQNKLQEKKNE